MKKNILLYDNGQEFDLDTLYEFPLGGSETSFLLLAKGLSNFHNVVLLTNKKIDRIQQQNIILDHNSNFEGYANNSDIIILNRSIPKTIDLFKNKDMYYYAHDAYDQPHVHWMGAKSNLNFFKKIFCVSDWQRETFIKYFNIEEYKDKLVTVGNSIDYSLFYGYSQRLENKLLYTSIPYKGLEILQDLFNDICIQSKRVDLELHIYSSMELYNQKELDKEYEQIYSNLSKVKNIYLHKPVNIKELSYQFKTSSIYLAPNLYHETFGMNLVMAQAGGCIPITTNLGAVNEVLDNNYIIKFPNIENNKAYKEYVNKIINLLNRDLYKDRLKIQEEAKNWDYLKTTNRVIKWL